MIVSQALGRMMGLLANQQDHESLLVNARQNLVDSEIELSPFDLYTTLEGHTPSVSCSRHLQKVQ